MDEISIKNILIKIIFLSIVSVLLRVSLSRSGQHWVNTFQQTLTIVLLPIISFVITNVIANDLALSLGMVGALSIIRFRNPVKNPLELVIFFGLVSLGISCAVSLTWSVFLALTLIGVFQFANIFSLFFKKFFNKNLFSTSFSEGNSLNILEINSKVKIEELEKNKFVVSFFYSNEQNLYCYKLSFKNENDVKELIDKYKNNPEVLDLKVDIN